MQSDPRTIATYWLQGAEADLRVCRDYRTELPPVACFHAQQCAAKSLKAILWVTSRDSRRTHVIDALLKDLAGIDQCIPPKIESAARSLDKYYAPTRYPDALGGADPFASYTSTDANATYEAADIVIRWARTIVTAGNSGKD